jgi:hypothetical protein
VANVELSGSAITLDWIDKDVRHILGRALEGNELTVDEGIRLTEVQVASCTPLPSWPTRCAVGRRATSSPTS